MIASSSRLAIGRLRQLIGGAVQAGIGGKTTTGRLSQAKLPIYKKIADLAHTHRFQESLSQQGGPIVPNSPMLDIEQAHQNNAELSHLAVHQAPGWGDRLAPPFQKYNSTIG
jgi:hypothetical protein